MIGKVKEAISIMKKAYNIYNANARDCLLRDLDDDYWHWKGLAEGTRRSFELLEELFNLREDK